MAGKVCPHCGAVREGDSQIGGEARAIDFINAMVDVGMELWRVLKPGGTYWLNLGDSYNGSGGAGGDYNSNGKRSGQARFQGANDNAYKPKDLVGIPWMTAMALRDRVGFWLRRDIVWEKPDAFVEGGARDRPMTSHEYVFMLTKGNKYYIANVSSIEVFKTLDEAKQFCQDHYNKLFYEMISEIIGE